MTTIPVTPKKRTKIGLFLRKILPPIIRGAVKQIPIVGTPIVEIFTNITTPKEVPNKHSWISIGVQVTCAILIIFAFYTDRITIQACIQLIKDLIPS